jgi:hypothetical protein
MIKPRVFIGSSSEALRIARAIEFQLTGDAEITIWNEGTFALSRGTLESLNDSLELYDFALFILSPDDLLTTRDVSLLAPRDNVMFELGLFMGRLGRSRTFMVCSSQERIKIPTDLAGITMATYDANRSDGNIVAAVGPACTLIRQAIEGLGPVRRAIQSHSFWKAFLTGGNLIVIGRFIEFKKFEQSGFLGVGDAMALSELTSYLELFGLRNTPVSYADRVDGDSLKTNLILIGGPDANLITKEALARIPSTFHFGDPKLYQIGVIDSLTQTGYSPRLNDNDEVISDYCIIIKTVNPFAHSKQILLIFGGYGYGSWAGARFTKSDKFLGAPPVSDGKDIECLIETDLVRETPQEAKIVILREIDQY